MRITISSLRSDSARSTKIVAVVLFCLTALVFSRSLFGSFQTYDDPDYVLNNPRIKNGLGWETIRWAFTTTTAANWHPLTWLSHTLDWTLYGDNPQGHHATNVLIHAFSAALAFLVLVRATGALWPSAACAALFALHPLRVESVAWIAERKDVLSVAFCWLALWAYLAYAERKSQSKPSTGWYVLTLFTFIAGLLCKPMLVTFPFVLLLIDYWPLHRFSQSSAGEPKGVNTITYHYRLISRGLPRLVWEKIPFFLCSVGASTATYFAQKAHDVVSRDLPFDARLGNAVVSVARYIGMYFWPDKLAVFYPHPGYWPLLTVFAASALLIGVSVLAILQLHRRPYVTVGWFWFVGTLVPTLGLVQVGLQSMADRYTYLPIFGLQVALIFGLAPLVHNRSRQIAAGSALAIWLIVLVGLTWRQQAFWKNPFTLFQHTIDATARNYLAWNNLGAAYGEQGRHAEALPYYRKSVELNPMYALARSNLAGSYAKTGSPALALKEYELAISLNPDLLAARRGYASSLTDANRPLEALEQHQFILARTPNDLEAINGAGVCFQLLGRTEEAEKMFLAALAAAPADPNLDTHINLGTIYATLGRLPEAEREFRNVLQRSPGYAQAHNNLANVLAGQGRLSEAVEHYHHAIASQPNNVEAHHNLGMVLFDLGRFHESHDVLAEAVKRFPNVQALRSALTRVEAKLIFLPPRPSKP